MKIIIIFISVVLATLSQHVAQTEECSTDQWQCHDMTCIPFEDTCDGVFNCPDHSDETFALCKKSECQSNLFRCMYGACVDGTAPCDGVNQCADSSDELLPMCRNVTYISGTTFTCDDGTKVPPTDRCDGVINCPDGSDETLKTCADMECLPYYFQCAYGACVDHGAECNSIKDCADNSDESNELCGHGINPWTNSGNEFTIRTPVTSAPLTVSTSSTITLTSIATHTTSTTIAAYTNKSDMCVLPAYPENGKYKATIKNKETGTPGQEFSFFFIHVTCNEGYGVLGNTDLYCYSGHIFKQTPMPKCVKYCRIQKVEGTSYRCKKAGSKDLTPCKEYEPPGTIAEPQCVNTAYYLPVGVTPRMTCSKTGEWDRQVSCVVDCGKVKPSSVKKLMVNGITPKHGEFPWHAAIYQQKENKGNLVKQQICGGSLISDTVVVSAAHCFWNDTTKKQLNTSNYAVGLGKIYARWEDPKDDEAQYFNITCIKLPTLYDGVLGNYQEDIALIKLKEPVLFNGIIRPVCIHATHLDLHIGRVAGWGLNGQGLASRILQYAKLEFYDIIKCKNMVPDDFRGVIGPDKLCAGNRNGTILRQGDSGGGLVFPDETGNRYFLKGIVSAAPDDDKITTKYGITTFTDVDKYHDFIDDFNCDQLDQ